MIGMEIRVLLEGGKLYAELPIQAGRFELTPRGGPSFTVVTKTGDAQITFVAGKDGAASGATLKYQGFNMRLAKIEERRPAKQKAAARRF